MWLLVSDLFPCDLVSCDAFLVFVGSVPVEESNVGPDVGESEVEGLRGEDVETLQRAVGKHGHVLDASGKIEMKLK